MIGKRGGGSGAVASSWPVVRSTVALTLAGTLLLNLGGSELVRLPPDEPGLTSYADHEATPAPEQRWGSANAGSDAADAVTNSTVPASLRGRFPLHELTEEPEPARNTAEVGEAPVPAVTGLDEETSVELPEARQEYERTFENADRSQTTEFSSTPLHYRLPDGGWEPIDPSLSEVGDGWTNTADAVDIDVAQRADAAELVRLTTDDGHALGLAVAEAAPSEGQAEETGVAYPGVYPGVDLTAEVLPGGVRQSLTLDSADAVGPHLFPLQLRQLSAEVVGDQVVFTDPAGVERAVIEGSATDAAFAGTSVEYRVVTTDTGLALEVAVDADWLQAADRAFPVEVSTTAQLPVGSNAADAGMYVHPGGSTSGGNELRVGRVDGANTASYLRFGSLTERLRYHTIYGAALQVVNYDSSTCTPRQVTVHPVTAAWSAGSAPAFPGPAVGSSLASRSFSHGYIATGQTSSNCPAAPVLFDLGNGGRNLVQRWVNGDQANHGLSLRASTSDGSNGKRLAGFSTANPPRLFVTHSPYNASYSIPNPVPDPPVLQNQAGKVTVTVTNRSASDWTPSSYYLAYRVYRADTGQSVTQQRAASLTSTVARGGRVSLEATVRPLPPGRYFLDFTMVRTGGVVFTDQQVPPGRIVLQVFDIPPVVEELYPPNGYQTPTLTPQLWARALDVDAPPGASLRYRFQVCERTSSGGSTGCFDSGNLTATAWTVPSGRLSWSKTYQWRVFVRDANNEVDSPFSALLTSVPQPEITSKIAGAPYGARDREFDPQVGNFSTAAVDASVATAGPALSLGRTYNSLDPRRDLMFGAGWVTQYDMTVVPDDDGSGNVVVTYPDGQQVRFGRNPDGSFAPPAGRTASLTADGGTWRLTDTSGTVYQFSGSRLTRITDAASRSVVLTYDLNNGRLARAQVSNSQTNTAGRALYFTWTGNRVTSVRTAQSGGPTWRYTYEGDLLTQVCAPDDSCTRYVYGSGTHYRSTVLDSRPESYWRLGEAQGTGAASEIAVNLGEDAATYRTVTLAAAGAIAGTDDTAAVFNGSSSHVELPKGVLKKSRDGAVELWFKTTLTGTGGPLLGYQDRPAGQTPTAGTPMLYVGTDGRLRGTFATTATAAGTVAPLTSTRQVNDGQWHHVVLSMMGSTQALYLDGVKVAEATGQTVEHSLLTHNQVGAAYATSPTAWPAWGSAGQRYYSGSIDEVAVYSRPLGPAAVTAHYRAGRTAADHLTSVILPSGKTAAEVTYDTTVERVDEYTDRHGGTWKVGKPLVFGGRDDLRRSVQVTDPAGRAELYEYDALAGRMLRSGLPLGIETREEDRPGGPVEIPEPPPPVEVCHQPDPADPGFCTIIPDDAGGPVFVRHPLDGMAIRTFGYDDRGFQNVVTNEVGDTVTMSHDDRGNVISRTTCRTANQCHTTRYTYPTNLGELDPRAQLPTEARDGRSAGASDNTYRTTYAYNAYGMLTAQTSPDGSTVTHTYTVGGEAASGGIAPAGLPARTTDPRGKVTSYLYYHNGDLFRITEPSGLVVEFTYDALGRKVTERQISDTFPAGVTTTYAYDDLSRLVSATGPVTTNEVTGGQHRLQTVNEYDVDGNLTTATTRDLLGDEPERITRYAYDEYNRQVGVIDAEGNETSYGYDRFGNQVFMVDPDGNRFEYAYTARNMISEVRLRNWASDPPGTPAPGPEDYLVLRAYSYDHAGRLASDTDAMGRRLEYQYFRDDLLHRLVLRDFRRPGGGVEDYVIEENSYDGAGHLTRQVAGNGRLVTDHVVDRAGKVTSMVVDPTGLRRTTAFTYDAGGNVLQTTRTGQASNLPWAAANDSEVVSYAYDDAGNVIRETVVTGSQNLVTSYGYDRRGLLTSVTDPRGNASGANAAAYTSTFRYDEFGRQIRATGPAVATETNGGAPTTVAPTRRVGYNAFGEPVAVVDERGHHSWSSYDRLGRPVSSTGPVYRPPGSLEQITPSTQLRYDRLGNVVEQVDPRGNVTRHAYDQLGRVTTIDAPAADNDDRAVWSYTYTRTGEVLSVTDPTGARVESTYDDLDRQLTLTQVERKPVADNYTTRFGYDDLGNLTRITTPSGAATVNVFDTVGALIRTTDPAGVRVEHGYDFTGRHARISDGLGRTTVMAYDRAGRQASQADRAPDGSVLRTARYGYDLAGNLTSATDAAGITTTYTYDAASRLVEQTEPVSAGSSITTSFGYDAAGNRTRYTDGRGNSTVYTHNSLGLPESVIEPATSDHPAEADRTWTAAYDPSGLPVRLAAPGGVRREREYDAAGRMVVETGAGAEAATGERRFGFDPAGRLIRAEAPDGSDAFTYNDRGALLSVSGPSGTAGFSYDADGNPVSRVDAAGTSQFTFDSGRLVSVRDGLTASVQQLSYDGAGQVASIEYGAGRVRSFGYDDYGRLTTDTLRGSGGQTVASISYEFDHNDHVIGKTTEGTAGAGENSYSYDLAGRLTSWTGPEGTTAYEWDASGNRTRTGSKTATYDERNRLLSDGDFTYAYTARGAVASRTSSGLAEEYTFDAFDRLVNADGAAYSYDSLGRLAARNGLRFSYGDLSGDPVSDGDERYALGPDNDLLAVGSGDQARLALTDAHGDLIGTLEPGAAPGLAASTAYDPFGQVTDRVGTTGNVGFQSDWTDPETGQVNMGARWYEPGTGSFISRDSVTYGGGASILANRYTYAAGAPLDFIDPDGHWPSWARSAANKAKSAAGAVGRAATRAGAAVVSGVRTVGGYVVAGARAVGNYLAAGFRAVRDFAISAVKAVGRAISTAARYVANKARAAISTVASVLQSGYRYVHDRAVAAGNWVKQNAAELRAQAAAKARAVTQTARNAVATAIRYTPLPLLAAAAKPLLTGLPKLVSAAKDLPAQVLAVSVNVVKDAKTAVEGIYHDAVERAGAVIENVSNAAQAVGEFVVEHKNTIAGVVAGVVVGVGCGVAIGWTGVGAVACGALAGAVGAMVTGYLNGERGMDLAKTGVVGGLVGGLTGGLGSVAGAAIGAGVRGLAAGGGRTLSGAAARMGSGAREEISNLASGRVGGVVGRLRGGCNSFTASSSVLMADGSHRPIAEVRVGDEVIATDPTTGDTAVREVTDVITGEGQKDLVEITVTATEDVTGLRNGDDPTTVTITATAEHPFWVAGEDRWVDAGDLKPGYRFETADHRPATVVAVRTWTEHQRVHNLTIDTTHTYYVTAGNTPVLVHNCGGTVWDDIKGTQPAIPGTGGLPKSFEMAAGNTKVWVHGNASKHIAEYAENMTSRGASPEMVGLGTQQNLRSLQAAVGEAGQGGLAYDKLVTAGGWELKFGAPRQEGMLPALVHARMVG